MRAKVLLSLAGALIAAVALVSASGAATTKAQKVTRIDVSTRASVIHYLRSIHVNPKGAVIERGGLNYAGARCPGGRWSCASTRHTVVQIVKRGGQNRFVCRSSKCVVVQISGVSRGVYIGGRSLASTAASKGNMATCVKTGSGATTGGGQICTIIQTTSGGPNTAGVYENTNKVSGLTQTAQYSASITQLSSGSNKNTACVTQNISLDGSASNTNTKPVTVNLNGFQTITIKQNSPAGDNSAEQAALSTGACDMSSTAMAQSQTLTSTVTTKGQITQNQDTQPSTTSCDGVTGQGSGCANVVTDIEQNQALTGSSGVNRAAFIQTSNQSAIANTVSGGTVSQTQDANVPDPPYSGIVGTINQDSTHTSTASATQNETQCEDAVIAPTTPTTCDMVHQDAPAGLPNLTQTQYGPEGILTPPTKHSGHRRVPYNHKGYGASQQTGNPFPCIGDCDRFTLNQTSTQNTDNGPHTTQGNIIQGDCTSIGGSCQAGQTATVNNNPPTSDGYTAGSIGQLKINCNGQACQPTPPPPPTFVSGPTSPNYSSSAVFNFNDSPATSGVSFLCKIDGGTPQSCSPNVAFFQGYGSHTFQVQAVDNFGNKNPVFVPTTPFGWTNVPPTPTITDQPMATSDSSNASFSFTDADSALTLECQIDNSGYSVCTSPWTYSNLADGSHTFSVKATDGTHESAVASFTWTISGGGATADTVDTLNPSSDPLGSCLDSYDSGNGFNGVPLKVTDTADLSPYDGQPIALRFSFSTGDALYNAFQGWYLNNIQVTGTSGSVFSDAVAAGDTSFTALGDHGVAPGWHVTHSNATMGSAWWYGNDATGTYQTPGSTDTCNDITPNEGTITTPVFTLGTNSQLSFDTLWQIEGVNSSTFDQMDVQVIQVTSAAG